MPLEIERRLQCGTQSIKKGETTMSVPIETLNAIMDALMGLSASARDQGNISAHECRRMQDDLPQLYNVQDKGQLILFLRKLGKRWPIYYAVCEQFIYQINS
jgi:hypothetical protein